MAQLARGSDAAYQRHVVIRFLSHSMGRLSVRWGTVACVLLGCDETSDVTGNGGSGDGRGGRGGTAGQSGQLNQGDASATDIADAAADADAGMVGSSGSGGSSGTPPGCPEPTPTAASPEHPIVIQSVHFSRSEVVLRNVSQTTQTLAGGRRGWQWCNIPDYWNIQLREEDVVLEPGGTYKFVLGRETGTVRELFPGDDPNDVNELGIYSTTGSFMTAELIEAFVSWGAGSNFGSRESVAVQGGVWTNSERIEIEPGHAGFIATGAADRGAGYTSVPARCLPAGP
jgi:hypothetical protein